MCIVKTTAEQQSVLQHIFCILLKPFPTSSQARSCSFHTARLREKAKPRGGIGLETPPPLQQWPAFMNAFADLFQRAIASHATTVSMHLAKAALTGSQIDPKPNCRTDDRRPRSAFVSYANRHHSWLYRLSKPALVRDAAPALLP